MSKQKIKNDQKKIEDLMMEKTEAEEIPKDEKVDENRKPANLKTNRQSGERNWYVIHTYSGYEEQVADNLKQRIESFGMEDKIFDVIVPKEKQIEIRNGKRRTVEKRIFPGYVLVDMIVDDDSWYVVRNTPNVTGFIGFGVRPTPMSIEEIERIKKRMGVEEPKYKIEFEIGDLVRIADGALKGFEAKVEDIDQGKGKIKVLVNMFSRETPVNLDFLQVKKI
ncbi:transcription termination/antitermination protein NusG [Candidatus Berkelbacteria bacterium CG08_land_8_20_14_0_20_39_8]|uniref:Transcription termination/antitermination protein NusG n=1 Tax=Candidatus Berkelbacteria bacterium CG08_land_8_20_14_0_20_39_8 TaxID=1974511 RepID=A0A2M6YCC2_9BACT|nr:MAG: transcription termination/antitermination protein NusG [Candidatus Berkelbacteria bacterium CG08_land_8_20_14_0_20_39_8]